MYIEFDDKQIHIQVICGSLESYKPSKEVKNINKKCEKIRLKLEKFQKEIEPDFLEVRKLIAVENKKFIPEKEEK